MSQADKKKGLLASFTISDRASCEAAIKNGGIAAMISAGLTALFALVGLFTSSSDKDLAILLDPWSLVDVVLIVVLGGLIFLKSRIASTLMLLYFVASKAFLWYQMGAPKGLPLTIIFLAFYLTAMRGTFLWHSTYKRARPAELPNTPMQPTGSAGG